MDFSPPRIPNSPPRTKQPLLSPSRIPTTPPKFSPGFRRLSTPNEVAGRTTPRARRPSEPLLSNPNTPSPGLENGTLSPGANLSRRSADRRRVSGAGLNQITGKDVDGLPLPSSHPNSPSSGRRRTSTTNQTTPKRPSQINTSFFPAQPSRSKEKNPHEPQLSSPENSNSSIPSGHPSAAPSKAGTPDREPHFFNESSFSSEFLNHSRIPLPTRSRSSRSSSERLEPISMSRQSSSRSEASRASSSRLTGTPSRKTDPLGQFHSNSRPPTPSPSGSPKRTSNRSANVAPPLPNQRSMLNSLHLHYGGSNGQLSESMGGSSSKIPLLGPVLVGPTGGSGNMDRLGVNGQVIRRRGSEQGHTIRPVKSLTSSPEKHTGLPLPISNRNGISPTIPQRESSAAHSSGSGVIDLSSPTLPSSSHFAAVTPPEVSPRLSSLPPLFLPNSNRDSTASSSSSPTDTTKGLNLQNVPGLGTARPAKSPARVGSPIKSGPSSRKGSLPASPSENRKIKAENVFGSPAGRSGDEGETVGQRRHQPDLRIDPPPPPIRIRSGDAGTLLQPPPRPSRTSSNNSTSTVYATPTTSLSPVPNEILHPVEASSSISSTLNAGSVYTRIAPGEYQEGPSPPIPARNPLRRRGSTRDGSSLSKSEGGSRATTPAEELPPLPKDSAAMLLAAGHNLKSSSVSRDSVLSDYSQPSAYPNSARSAVSSGSETTIAANPIINKAAQKGLRIEVGSVKTAPPVRGDTPTTADLVRVMGFVTEMESKIPDIRKALPDTPEEASPPSGTSEQQSRLQDERYRYPHRAGPNARPVPSQGHSYPGLSPSKSPSMPNFATMGSQTMIEGLPLPRVPSYNSRVAHNGEKSPSSFKVPLRPQAVHTRSQSSPISPVVQVSTPDMAFSPASLTSSIRMTRRAHLINEICATERSYATDLALVRDVYLRKLRPVSQVSANSTILSRANDGTSPGANSSASRLSTYTYETAGTSRTVYDPSNPNSSKQDLSSPDIDLTLRPDLKRTSSMASTQTAPRSMSFQYPVFVETTPVNSDGSVVRRRNTVSDPLSPSDIRTVFMNLEQLAAFADELATMFERAMGDASGAEPILKEGYDDTVTDRLGEVFISISSKLTNLYTPYCARQAQANTRLSELMQDAKAASHLQTCWSSIQPYTNAWDLGSMLIKPVQRMMKYPLLFGDLLQCTSPVHPDYFNLRKAFENATSIAGEINEVKRRKDVVERIITKDNKKRPHTTGSVPVEKPKVFGMSAKLREKFSGKNKDKDRVASNSSMTSMTSTNSFSSIAPGSERPLYEMIARLDAADKVVRKVGKEINMFPDKVRETWQAQKDMMVAWSSVVRLDGSDLGDERIDMYANMVDDIMERPWAQLEGDVREAVMPIFSTLLRLGVNPKTLITKRESRLSDYTKVQTSRSKSDLKSMDKSTISGAEDFVALHTQLLEELPAYIEGHGKILDLALGHFAASQARFYDSVRKRFKEYLMLWTATEEVEGVEAEVLGGQRIIDGWRENWSFFSERMESLTITHELVLPKSGTTSRVVSLANSNSTPSVSSSSTLLRASSQNRPSESLSTPSFTVNRARSSSFLSNPNHIHLNSARSSRPSSIISEAPSMIRGNSDLTEVDSLGIHMDGAPRRSRPISYLPPVPRTDGIIFPDSHKPGASPLLGSNYLLNSPSLGNDGEMMEWKDQAPLYPCACVAPFKLDVEVWYAGLAFLNMEEGEVVDILNEVGRIDQLADLPIDVGVADDGLLVARARDGKVGLILCSFLEPL